MTLSIDSMAIFGGEPALTGKLYVGRPNIGSRERLLERFQNIIDSRWLTNGGPYLQEFEKRIAEFVGVKHCIGMCNATIALEIAIRALGMTGEVIVPSFTFIATAHALQWQEITPVFCDIDPVTHNIDPRRIEELITPRTTGIIGVHLWGRPCNIDALQEIATRRGLTLLFDSAHAFGCSYHGRMIGNFGHAEVFSFHATKFFNTFEGGAVVTNDDALAEKVRLMQNFGFAGYDLVNYIGTNGKMNEVAAAAGLTSMECLDDFIAVNRKNYQHYQECLAGLKGLRLAAYDETEKCNFQYIVLEVDESEIGLSRDELIQILWAENVLARRYFYPGCHRAEPYRSRFPNAGERLPETESLVKRVLTLPTGTAAGRTEIEKVAKLIGLAVTHGKEIHERLQQKAQSKAPISVLCSSAQ